MLSSKATNIQRQCDRGNLQLHIPTKIHLCCAFTSSQQNAESSYYNLNYCFGVAQVLRDEGYHIEYCLKGHKAPMLSVFYASTFE